MARATPNNTKAARKEAKLKYELKPELKLQHPTNKFPQRGVAGHVAPKFLAYD